MICRAEGSFPISDKALQVSAVPWVLVAGGFHWRGGIDRANAEFALYLNQRGTPLHLVSYQVDDAIARRQNVKCHIIHRPYNSFFLGEFGLHRAGVRVARAVLQRYPDAHVLVNGGNCPWGDLNWMHNVHAAWKCADRGAPPWFRIKNRITKKIFVSWEEYSVRRARIVITNSRRTRREAIEKYGLDPRRVHTVYLGSDQNAAPVTPEERHRARVSFRIPEHAQVVLFVGALGYDNNKGLDTLLSAWQRLRAEQHWDAYLLVAGGGAGAQRWSRWCADRGLADRVRLLGFTDNIPECLAAADLLVSPVRYEGYGLNIHEALCRGVPVMVSRSAGVAERIPEDLSDMLIGDPEDVGMLARRLVAWSGQLQHWKARIEPLRRELSRYSWSNMAEEMINLVGRNTEVSRV